jgi:thiamine kinase-like enzyme
MSLPSAADPQWLTAVLRRQGCLVGGRVADVTVVHSEPTVLSHIYRLRLTYDGAADGAPSSLVLKAKHLQRPVGIWKHGEREVAFYREVAPATPAGLLPRCFDTHWDASTGDWHLLLEDLKSSHRFVSTRWPLPPPLADCRSVVRALARFHAAWWNDSRLGKSIGTWLDPAEAGASRQRFADEVARFADALGDLLSAERRRLYERIIESWDRLGARYHTHRNMTVVHGDAHVWNCFLPLAGSEEARLFDWDTWRPDTAADDLAYMMAMHWYPDVRSRREQHLLDIYHDELQARSVSLYDRQALQDDYRLSVLWSTATPVWQRAGDVPPVIWWNNLERIHLAVDDLGCRDLLG